MSYFLSEEERAISIAGRTYALYIPKAAKQYVDTGDVFKVTTRMVNGEMEIVARRKIFHFEMNDVRSLAEQHNLKVKYDGEVEGTRILDATDDLLTVKSMQSKLEQPYGLVHVVVGAKLFGLAPQNYKEAKKLVDTFRTKFNISFMPEGDVDTVKVFEHPEYYGVKDDTDLFNRFEKMNKKIGASITARLDNRKNELRDVDESIRLVEKLQSTIKEK